MRNKDLMEQNFSLFEQLQKALHDIELLKQQVLQCQSEIQLLKNGACSQCVASEEPEETEDVSVETEAQEDEEIVAEPEEEQETVEYAPVSLGVNINSNPDAEYGSQAIGKIIVSSSEYAIKKPQAANLILGKTEIAKAEIMSIIASEISLQQKKDEIDIVLAQAEEYFEGVNA